MNINGHFIGWYGDTEHVPAIRNTVVRYSFVRGWDRSELNILRWADLSVYEGGKHLYIYMAIGYMYIEFSLATIKYILK